LTESNYLHAKSVLSLQSSIFNAGKINDIELGKKLIEKAVGMNIRPSDILIGMIAPMLYQIGKDWSRGRVSVEEEHRFTAFCEKIFTLVAAKANGGQPSDATKASRTDVLLMNAPGNSHTLAIRILALVLAEQDVQASILHIPLDLEALIATMDRIKPRLVLISIALAEQYASVAGIAERIAAMPKTIRPKVVVGGYAVKLGLISAIPGAELMADISQLQAGF
jgi:methanogenic corrinoid protein MtbC1